MTRMTKEKLQEICNIKNDPPVYSADEALEIAVDAYKRAINDAILMMVDADAAGVEATIETPLRRRIRMLEDSIRSL